MNKEKFAELEKKLNRIEKALRYLANDSHVDEPITPQKLFYALQRKEAVK